MKKFRNESFASHFSMVSAQAVLCSQHFCLLTSWAVKFMQSNHEAHFSHPLLKVMVDIQSGKAIKLSQVICPDVIFLLNKSICVCIAVYYESSIVPHYCGALNVWFDRNGDLNGLRKHVYVPLLCALSIRLNCRQNDDNKKLADATHLIFFRTCWPHSKVCGNSQSNNSVLCPWTHTVTESWHLP